MMTALAEMDALKARLKATWEAGDYGHFARYMEPGALEFLARLKIAPGMQLLDVACGAGQIAIPAARAGAEVVGVDIASNLVVQARAHAREAGVDVEFEEGDAEDLPYDDASFDLVVSLIGAMFAPRPERVAHELLRVCRPGGRVVMANWTAEGHIGQMFRIIGAYAPPSPLMASPLRWGDEACVQERFLPAHWLETTRREYPMRFPFGPAKVVDFFREFYGPANRAFVGLDTIDQQDLRENLVELWTRNNLARDGTTFVQAEYLEVVAFRE